ncbi:MAG TPA: hypothetical protein VNT30_05675 [Stellaceae bacterium]|nr:hypothetical protein [Stellaceae bacterium]
MPARKTLFPITSPVRTSRRDQPFAHAGIEPSLDELFDDTVMHAIMRRDGVTPECLRHVVAATQRRLAEQRC